MSSESIKPAGYTVEQAARIFSKSRQFIYKRAKEQRLKIVKLSERSSLVTRDSMVTYAEQCGLPITF